MKVYVIKHSDIKHSDTCFYLKKYKIELSMKCIRMDFTTDFKFAKIYIRESSAEKALSKLDDDKLYIEEIEVNFY